MLGSGGEPDPFAIEKIEHGAIILYNESIPAAPKGKGLLQGGLPCYAGGAISRIGGADHDKAVQSRTAQE